MPSNPGKTNLTDIFKLVPQRAALMLRLADDVLRADSPLSIAQRELIFAYGSAQNACDFCYASHRPVAAAFGIDEKVFDELITDTDSASVDSRLGPVSTNLIITVVPKISPIEARGEKFGCSK